MMTAPPQNCVLIYLGECWIAERREYASLRGERFHRFEASGLLAPPSAAIDHCGSNTEDLACSSFNFKRG